ncbi:MAG: hypothetical protein V4757_20565 [Pseudomonadota bacterium]
MPQDISETAVPRFQQYTHYDPTLAHVKADDMIDQVAAVRDVQNAYDFIHLMIDPLEGPRVGPTDMEWAQLASLLRIVNRDLNGRLNAMDRMMEPAQHPTRPATGEGGSQEAGPP